MRILSFDSSAKSASVAIVEDNKIIGSSFINTNITHSQTLVPMTEQLLSNTNLTINDVDVLAVSVGPGSFTGVRIGVSVVKGIAMPLSLPCIAVSTLESMAYNYMENDCIIASVMDARCNQVYNGLFKFKNGEIERLCEDRAVSIIDLENELKEYNQKVILIGDGAQLCYETFGNKYDNIYLAPENIRYQNAVGVAFAAFNKETVSAEKIMPTYLRLPQAQRELKKRLENEK